MKSFIIENANIVLPDSIIYNGSIAVQNGIITVIAKKDENIDLDLTRINAGCKWLFPGLIDLHNDAIEKEIEPRPNALFPMEIALFSLESRLLCHGITTIFHSLSFVEAESNVRNLQNIMNHIEGINRVKKHGSIRHFIHARYEIPDIAFYPIIDEMIDKDMIQLLSFMDHTPGQGQYKDVSYYRQYLRDDKKKTQDEINKIVAMKKEKSTNPKIIDYLCKLKDKALKHGLIIASHDDDSEEKILFMKKMGVTISEFPVNIETALAARKHGQHIILGAPNVIRGGSNTGNMKAIDAILNNAADSLCSDYHPSSMLHSIFMLHRKYDMCLARAVNMVSLNPAKALKLDETIGSIECGKIADIILVREIDQIPVVEEVFVGGVQVLKKREIEADHGFYDWNKINKLENAIVF
jgi:alpha-D-ribose 1-methylphosphonate 5-triphosphate diphosphatase